jgi:hypothetical protein
VPNVINTIVVPGDQSSSPSSSPHTRTNGQPCSTVGSGCAGSFNKDVHFEQVAYPTVPSDVTVFSGNTSRANEKGQHDTAVIVSRTVPPTLTLRAGVVERFVAAVTTTVAMPVVGYDPVADAVGEYLAAVGNGSSLMTEHTAAWAEVWSSGGIDVLGVADDTTGRAFDIQTHVRSSFYYMVSVCVWALVP